MKENSEPGNTDAGNAPYVQQRQLCLEHSRDLIASAERVPGIDARTYQRYEATVS
jgi:hypothetical protein